MTEFERSIRAITMIYRESKGLPPLASDEIPESIRKPSLAERLIGRDLPPCEDKMQRRQAERECRRAYNAKGEK